MHMPRPFCRALVLLAALGLSGCVGIAHTLIPVPPLQVQLQTTPTATAMGQIDVLRPEFWADGQTFVALVKDSLVSDKVAYEWQAASLSKVRATEVVFPKEERYIGFPVFIIPWGPSNESSRKRRIFLRVANDDELYRVSITGDKAVIEVTSLAAARRNLPPALQGPRPVPPAPEWRAWSEAEEEFYKSITWRESRRISVNGLQRSDSRDVLSLQVGNKIDG
jgi:hypothetical protein